ncbi:hypothetical protein [Pseudophaeobacter sp.]|uniref:hypothetical protein n=1 Tax=Pseudophaeobacter sp. TaxID=1971739 RepID=UPI0032973396
MSLSNFLDVTIAIATVVAAIAAAIGVWKYRSDARASRTLRWQKTTVQAILQQTEDVITFDDLKLRYRSFAADHMRDTLGTSDISDEALRMILVELCASNVLVQLGKDSYCLATYLGEMRDMHSIQKTFFEAQLEFLSSQDNNIRNMVREQRRATDSIAQSAVNINLAKVEN